MSIVGMIAVAVTVNLPIHEVKVIREVAAEYGLDRERTVLLAAIRCRENGLAGLEFGIGGVMDSGHPAHRFAIGMKDRHIFNEKSFRCQARWAAGTIRKRYNGNLLEFARRYCPRGAWEWYVGVTSLMMRIGREGIVSGKGEGLDKPTKK